MDIRVCTVHTTHRVEFSTVLQGTAGSNQSFPFVVADGDAALEEKAAAVHCLDLLVVPVSVSPTSPAPSRRIRADPKFGFAENPTAQTQEKTLPQS
jgi:hypothetical protein